VNPPERFIPALVRLEPIDSFYCLGPHSFYFSKSFGFVSGFVLRNRKFDASTRFPSGAEFHKLVSEMVERTPQIVNYIPGSRKDIEGQLRKTNHVEAFTRVRVGLGDNYSLFLSLLVLTSDSNSCRCFLAPSILTWTKAHRSYAFNGITALSVIVVHLAGGMLRDLHASRGQWQTKRIHALCHPGPRHHPQLDPLGNSNSPLPRRLFHLPPFRFFQALGFHLHRVYPRLQLWKVEASGVVVLALRLSPVSLFVAVTVALGTAAPVASLTWPMIALVVSPWGKVASDKRQWSDTRKTNIGSVGRNMRTGRSWLVLPVRMLNRT
jgi:hypothetical protein